MTSDYTQEFGETPGKNIDVKGSILPYRKSTLMIIPMKIGISFKKCLDRCRSVSLHPIKAPAVFLGMVGSVFVAMPATVMRLAGFSCWMIANFLWVFQGVKVKDFYLMALFGFYFVTAALGIYNIT